MELIMPISHGFCDPSTSWTSPLCAWNSHLAGLRRNNVRDPDGCHITGSFAWLIPGRGQGLWCLARDVKHCELIHPGHDASDRVGRCWEVSQPRQCRPHCCFTHDSLISITDVAATFLHAELGRASKEKLWLSNQDVKTMESCVVLNGSDLLAIIEISPWRMFGYAHHTLLLKARKCWRADSVFATGSTAE